MEIMHARIDSSTRSNDLYLKEMPVIAKFKKAEFIIGKKASLDDNDFYIELSKEYFKKMDIQKNDLIYIPNSEFGGFAKKIQNADDSTVKITGVNWRYFLHRFVIFPKYNSNYKARDDYLTIDNEEIHKALEILFNNVFYSAFLKLYRVSDKDTQINTTVSSRYDYLYDKIINILDEKNMRLKVYHTYDYDDRNIVVEAVEKNVIDDVYNRDYSIEITSSINSTNSVDTMIALGKGDLHDRKIVLIKHSIDEDGNDAFEKITDLSKDEIGNIDSSMYVYDYKSCESDDDLVEKAIEEFKNHLETKEINLGVTSLKKELELGDIITSVDDITGLSIETEITRKILTIENGMKKIEYKVGE